MALRDHEILLRVKDDTGSADPSYTTLMIDPNTAIISVGTAGNGTWSLVIDPVDGAALSSVDFVRASSENSSQIATAWAAAINGALSDADGPTELARYVVRAVASAATVRLTVKRGAPRFGFTVTSPGSTATVSPVDLRWPIAQYIPTSWGGNRETTKVVVRTVPIDSSGNVIPVDTAATFTMRALDGCEQEDGTTVIASHGAEATGVAIGESRSLPYGGGLFGLELSAVSTPPTGLAALRVWVYPTNA